MSALLNIHFEIDKLAYPNIHQNLLVNKPFDLTIHLKILSAIQVPLNPPSIFEQNFRVYSKCLYTQTICEEKKLTDSFFEKGCCKLVVADGVNTLTAVFKNVVLPFLTMESGRVYSIFFNREVLLDNIIVVSRSFFSNLERQTNKSSLLSSLRILGGIFWYKQFIQELLVETDEQDSARPSAVMNLTSDSFSSPTLEFHESCDQDSQNLDYESLESFIQ